MPLDRELILGSWRMKSWVTTDVATGERRDALGENVRGFALYTPERVMFLILKNNRKPPERSPPTDEEKIALYDTMFAYSGSYTVESDRIIHHVDLSWNDSRNDPTNAATDVYFAQSTDGGASVSPNVKVTSAPTNETVAGADLGNQYGDYEGIDARGGVIHPIWTDRRASVAALDEEAFTATLTTK